MDSRKERALRISLVWRSREGGFACRSAECKECAVSSFDVEADGSFGNRPKWMESELGGGEDDSGGSDVGFVVAAVVDPLPSRCLLLCG